MMRVAVLFFSCSTALLAGCGKADPTGDGRAAAPSNTADLTYKDVLEKLRAAGLKVNMAPLETGDQLYTTRGRKGTDWCVHAYTRSNPSPQAETDIFCFKHGDEKSAREYVGSTESGSFQWGVFVFRGKPTLLAAFKKALEGEKVTTPVLPKPNGPEEEPDK